ncbi:MAG: DCC1-like thiol-disulfide oxidoreductase family protein [Chitinophagales bacterium]
MRNGILLFDGVCNLCNSSVNFIIDRDRNDHFRFTSLQSEKGKQLLIQHHIDPQYLDSLVLIEGEKALLGSDAVLKIAATLGFPYSVIGIFKFLPYRLRDRFYNWVAANRYKWFGKRAECRMPTPDLQSKFL